MACKFDICQNIAWQIYFERRISRVLTHSVASVFLFKSRLVGVQGLYQLRTNDSQQPLLCQLNCFLVLFFSGKLPTFTVLCEQYQPSLKRDPVYLEYLDRIGQLFFGLPPPSGPSAGGGMFGEYTSFSHQLNPFPQILDTSGGGRQCTVTTTTQKEIQFNSILNSSCPA